MNTIRGYDDSLARPKGAKNTPTLALSKVDRATVRSTELKEWLT